MAARRLFHGSTLHLKLKLIRGLRFHSTTTKPVHDQRMASKTAALNDDDVEGRLQPDDLDLRCLTDEKSLTEMRDNIARRGKGVGDVDLVKELYDKCRSAGWRDVALKERFLREALRLPNRCHPAALTQAPHQLQEATNSADSIASDDSVSREFHEIAEEAGWLRRSGIGAFVGGRSYFLIGALAQLEAALCKYTLRFLTHKGFELVVVPDILRPEVIDACSGMTFQKERTQMYCLDREHYGPACLSGTSEMALAALFANEILPQSELPRRVCAVSRCFRAETSRLKEETGIFRVHQFTKVEMFCLTSNDTGSESEVALNELVSIQTELFGSLGLRIRLVDMPPNELGPAAYRKYDVEVWMPGRRLFGEVSSASNCTDYQSRRLNIRYAVPGSGQLVKHVHTLNGTACAVPRMLIALLETHQRGDGSVAVPQALRPYFEDDFLRSSSVKGRRLKILRRADGSR